MRRLTHLLLGAAVAMPIAASLSPALAVGGVWCGIAGGAFPDWLDLRSELRRPLRLRHRGVSHSVLLAALLSFGFGAVLVTLQRQPLDAFGVHLAVPEAAVRPWYLCFLFGILSHLVGDAMTYGGIQPLLPLSRARLHLLPRFLRSRYDGYLDTLARSIAMVVIAAGIAYYVTYR